MSGPWEFPVGGLSPIERESTQSAIATAGRFITEDEEPALIAGSVRLLADYCHGLSRGAGWWTDPKTREPAVRVHGELLMLAVSELSEAMEGVRKGLQDDKLPHRPMVEVELADCAIRCADAIGGLALHGAPDFAAEIAPLLREVYAEQPENVASELAVIARTLLLPVNDQAPAASCHGRGLGSGVASALLRCLFLGKSMGLDVPGAIAEKLAFNSTREDHKLDARAAPGGKAF